MLNSDWDLIKRHSHVSRLAYSGFRPGLRAVCGGGVFECPAYCSVLLFSDYGLCSLILSCIHTHTHMYTHVHGFACLSGKV